MKTITISRKQFSAAAERAVEEFDSLGKNPTTEREDFISALMGLQNALFANILGDILFNDGEDE